MSDILTKIKAELEAYNEKRKQLVAELRKDFPLIFAPLFEKSKRIDSIGWNQYTPYFNDGDTCEFGVNNYDLYVNETYQDEVEWVSDSTYNYTTKKYEKGPEYDEVEAAIVDEFRTLLQTIPEDFYKDLFGDHVKVTMYRNGKIEVEDYDHD